LNNNQIQSNEISYKVSSCENAQQQSCSITIPLCNGPQILTQNVTIQPAI